MDFAFYRFITAMNQRSLCLLKTMSALVNRVNAVIQFLQSGEAALKSELAETKASLAAALANDAADAETIAVAQAAATVAQEAADAANAKVTELQSVVAEDAEEDAAIHAILDAVPGAPS